MNIDYDAEYARRVQVATDERIAAQLLADEQSRAAADAANEAATAKRQLDLMKASAEMSMSALDAGGASYGFDAASESASASSGGEGNSNALLIAALAAFGVFALLRRKGR